MSEVNRLLGQLPEESPPPEIVLSAVRSFRYRAVAIVSSMVAGILLVVVLAFTTGPDNLASEAGRLSPRGVVPLLVSGHLDSVKVTLVELVQGEDVGYIHFLVEEGGEEIIVEVEPVNVLISPEGQSLRQVDFDGQSFAVGALDQIGGSHYGGTPDAASGWIRYQGEHDAAGELAVHFRIWFLAAGDTDLQDGYEMLPRTLQINVPGEVE